MRCRIVAVGRMRAGPLATLTDEYRRRCPWPVDVVEVVAKAREGRAMVAEEGSLLLAKRLPGAATVALDERGRDLSSAELAARLGVWRDEGRAEVAFLVGGADGHDDAVRSKADLLLAFGRATWPHLMVRAMLAEQIYRASCILAGHPYHRA